MSFDTYESSADDGKPIEIYLFRCGPSFQAAYTSSSSSVTVGPITYLPEAISRDKISQDTGEQPQLSQIVVPYDSPVAKLFRAYLPAYPVFVSVQREHDGDLASEWTQEFVGVIASVADDDDAGTSTLSCRPVGEAIRNTIVWQTFGTQCNWATYSPGCGLDKNDWRTVATVTYVDETTIKASAFASKPDGWFAAGWVEAGDAERRFVINHVGDTLTLQNPFPGLAIGTSVSAYAGDQRTEDVCRDKFANLQRFRGFARIPTKNPYSTNVYGQSGGGASPPGYSGGGDRNSPRTLPP